MDNVNTSPGPESPRKFEHQNRRKEAQQRPYKDLREVINQKRQAKEESKFNIPPAEPKYNFLSDPSRDSHNNKSEQFDTGRYYQRGNSDFRGRGKGRGRGPQNNNYRFNFRKEDSTQSDNFNSGHGYYKNNEGNEEGSSSNTTQYRPFSNRPNFRQYDQEYSINQNDQETTENSGNYKPRNFRKYERGNHFATHPDQLDSKENFNTRNNFHSRGSQYYRPPHRHNPHFRGQPHKRNPKSLDPVNITVQYTVDTGVRKCKVEKKTFTKDKNQQKTTIVKCAEPECEENWDEEAYANQPSNESLIENTKEVEHNLKQNKINDESLVGNTEEDEHNLEENEINDESLVENINGDEHNLEENEINDEIKKNENNEDKSNITEENGELKIKKSEAHKEE